MTLYRGNDQMLRSEVLTDTEGEPLVSGTVKVEILDVQGLSSLVANAAMSHDSSGVWQLILTAVTATAQIAVSILQVLVRITIEVDGIVVATFDRVENVQDRKST